MRDLFPGLLCTIFWFVLNLIANHRGVFAAEPVRQGSRHPLVSAIDKDAYNAWIELQSALSGAAYDDACRIVMSLSENALKGLLPDSQDQDLFVAFPVKLDKLSQTHPMFDRVMNEQFAAQGMIRVRAAIDRRDHRALIMATRQFPATPAARDAHLWLGDSALAAGLFLEAGHHFRRSIAISRHTPDESLNARLELATTLAGGDLHKRGRGDSTGTSPHGPPLNLNGHIIPRKEFDAIIEDIASTRNADRGFVGSQSTASVPYPLQDQTLCLHTELDSADLAQSLPLIMGDRLYVVRQNHARRELLCMNCADGKRIWVSHPSIQLLSDPVNWNNRLMAATMTKGDDDQFLVNASMFDRETGSVDAVHPLFRLYEPAENAQFAITEENSVITTSGTICCFNSRGEVKWLRRFHPVRGTEQTSDFDRQRSIELGSTEHVIHLRSDVSELHALNLESGQILWRRPLPMAKGLLAASKSRVAVRTSIGMAVLEEETGWTVRELKIRGMIESASDDGDQLTVLQHDEMSEFPKFCSVDLDPLALSGKKFELKLPDAGSFRRSGPFWSSGRWWMVLNPHEEKATLYQMVNQDRGKSP